MPRHLDPCLAHQRAFLFDTNPQFDYCPSTDCSLRNEGHDVSEFPEFRGSWISSVFRLT